MVSVTKGTRPVAENHIPVLLREAVAGLEPHPGGVYIDGTVGTAGHAVAVLEAAGPGARLLGIDADPQLLARAAQRLEPFGDAVVLEMGNFRHLRAVAEDLGFTNVDGILLDLGVSSLQLGSPDRGFSFQDEGVLDMRLSPHQRVTAADLVNSCPEQALADLIFRYGEEPAARRIAHHIVVARPLHTTTELAGTVARAVPRRGSIHPATRTFQALRIAVNDELGALREALPQAMTLLATEGRLAVISFHSLEDRIVKEFFRMESRGCVCPPQTPLCVCGHLAQLRVITPRPVRPSPEEVAKNHRSRSARLRIAQRV